MKKSKLVFTTLLVVGLLIGGSTLSSCYAFDEEQGENDTIIDPDDGSVINPDGEESTNPDGGGSTTNPEGGSTTNPDGGSTTNPDGEESTNPDGGSTTNPDGGSTTNPDGGGSTTNPDSDGIKYTVTYEESDFYNISFASDTNEYAEGEIVEFTATASIGYKITDIQYNELSVTEIDGNLYSFEMPGEDVVLSIEFDDSYTVFYTDRINYDVSFVSGTNEYAEGETVEFTIDAATGYKITNVLYNGVPITDINGNLYSFEMPGENVILSISFEEAYSVFYTEKFNYTVSFIAGTDSYIEGETVEFTVTAISGYRIKSVSYNETTLVANEDNIYSFEMPANDVTLTIDFVKTYTVSYINNPYYSVSFANGTNIYEEGETVEFTVTATTGYRITAVGYNEEELTLTSNSTYSFEMPAENVTLNVDFIVTYTITYEESSCYSVSFTNGSNIYVEGETVEFTVTASSGYRITGVSYNGEELTATSGNTYSFEMPDRDVTLTIDYIQTYTVTYSSSSYYSVSFTSGTNIYAEGETVEFTVTPATDYRINSVAYNGTTLTATSGNTYSFEMPAQNVTLTISYSVITYTISRSYDSSLCTVTLISSSSLPRGATAQFSVYFYSFNRFINGVVVRNNTTGSETTLEYYDSDVTQTYYHTYYYRFTMPASNVTIVVSILAL